MRLHLNSIRALPALCWIAALSAGATMTTTATRADITVSRSNDPAATVDGRLSQLLDLERAGVGQVGAIRMATPADGVQAPAPKPRGAAEPEKPVPIRYDAGWLAAQPLATGDAQWDCLSKALYFEARGETVKGQFAVAEVVLNRVSSGRYPRSVCGVVNQAGNGGCQFSFVCDGLSDRVREPAAWRQAGRIARLMLDGAPRGLTRGAMYFHSTSVRPRWAGRFAQTAAIGAHRFYRQP